MELIWNHQSRRFFFSADRGGGKAPDRFHGNIIVIGISLTLDSRTDFALLCALLQVTLDIRFDEGYRGYNYYTVVNPLLYDIVEALVDRSLILIHNL